MHAMRRFLGSGAFDGEPSAAAGKTRGAHVAHTEGSRRVPGGAETGDGFKKKNVHDCFWFYFIVVTIIDNHFKY